MLANFFLKNHLVNVLGFVGHVVSAPDTQLCIKAVTHNMQINEHGCVPI